MAKRKKKGLKIKRVSRKRAERIGRGVSSFISDGNVKQKKKIRAFEKEIEEFVGQAEFVKDFDPVFG